MLNKIADFYRTRSMCSVGADCDDGADHDGRIGGMVGFMRIAMYMPIFDIAGAVQTE